jgi:hypothetical protein
MDHAIRTDFDRNAMNLSVEWDPPVAVFIDGFLEIIASPLDALFWLDNQWPDNIPRPEEAQLACYQSLATSRGLRDARSHFIEACRRAEWDPFPERAPVPPSSRHG